MEFAKAEFVLGNNNLRRQLEKVEEQTGRRPPQLDSGGELPDDLSHVWGWFLELSSCRAEMRALSHTELASFFELYGIEPEFVELEALKRLDREWILHKANSDK